MGTTAASSIEFVVRGPIRRADLAGLADRFCAALTTRPGGTFECHVTDVQADAVTVEALARLQLLARRNRCTVRLRGASSELLELVALMGLENVLGDRAAKRPGATADRKAGKAFRWPERT
jgi:ABC-type transporter Mla MlaB component